MAQPQARSYNQILGDMVAGFLAKKRLPKMKPASAVLTVLEASAQSHVRSTQDIFASLNAQSLDRTEKTALDRIGESENVPRRLSTAATGIVTLIDTAVTKKATRLSPAKAAPIVGSVVLYLVDATGWATSGSIYLGRGTDNYEGPIPYSGLVDSGSFWTMTLSSPTQRFHQQQEGVVLAQGGDRAISAGQQVSTDQGIASQPVAFSTLYPAIIPDGESLVEGVFVICTVPGTIGNVPQGAITTANTPPFPTLVATNPSGFVTGKDTESDADYRDRIKAERATRSKATDLTLQTRAVGVTSDEDSRRVVSAAIVRRENEPTTLYIDDGTGYEERSDAIALEPLIDSALGGEDCFQLAFRPVAKATVTASRTAPYTLPTDAHIAVYVGGVLNDHFLNPDDFRSISAASAYEIVASINANPNISFSARTAEGGTKVALFAKTDTNEDIQVTVPVSGEDANDVLGFSVNRVDTLKLYKNDRLLNKDGVVASLSTNVISSWSSLSGTETLTLAVDGTPAVTYSFTATDFVNASTGYTAMGINSPAAWAAVFNSRIPGVTAIASADTILLTSNAGRLGSARLAITGGTLVSKNMFELADVQGANADYTLNRNTGELRLKTALAEGDSLAAGSFNTRAFLESEEISPVTLGANGNAWFVVDGDAEQIVHGVVPGALYSLTRTAVAAGDKWVLATLAADFPFVNVQVGDWFIVWDTGYSAGLRTAVRVIAVGGSGASITFEFGTGGGVTVPSFSFAAADLRFIRTNAHVQKATLPAGANYTALAFANSLNTQLQGAVANTYRTTTLRVKTRSFKPGGDLALVAADTEADKMLIAETEEAVENLDGHLASVEAGNPQAGTPDFTYRQTSTQSAANNQITAVPDAGMSTAWDKIVVGDRNVDVGAGRRIGNNRTFQSMVASLTVPGNIQLTHRENTLLRWMFMDAFWLAHPYAIGPNDDLTVVADQDTTSKRFMTRMTRTLKPDGGVYGSTNTFKDADNSNLSLTQAFGLGYSFDDFTVYMRARVLTHSADATKRILWRWKRFGADGNTAAIRYVYPSAPSQPVNVTVSTLNEATVPFPTLNDRVILSVNLPSDVQKTGYTLTSAARIGYGSFQGALTQDGITVAIGFPISSAQRTANVTTVTLTLPTSLYSVTNHNLQIGDQVFVASTNVNFTSGVKTITARTNTTVSYAEVAADIGATPNIGTLSFSNAEMLFTGATPTPIAVGDIVHFTDAVGIPNDLRGRSIRITHLGPQFLQGYADRDYDGVQSQALTWSVLSDPSKIQFYGLLAASATATAIAAAVNALTAKCPVTATVTGTGAGQILLSSREEAGTELAADEYKSFADGINWVTSTTSPGSMAGDYQLTFKAPITAGLTTNSDWANEEIRIAPASAKSVVQWLNTPAASGLFAVATVDASSAGTRPQIASLTPGTAGSIQVQGGLANTTSAAVQGAGDADPDSGCSTVAVLATESLGFTAGNWVELENSEPRAMNDIITAATAVTSINGVTGEIILSAGLVFNSIDSDTSIFIEVSKQGRYVRLYGLDAGNEGDWLYLSPSVGSPLSAPNLGLFKIIRTDTAGNCTWIENPNAVEEAGNADWRVLSDDMTLVPGMQLVIASDAWGAANKGTWTVTSVGDAGSGEFGNALRFKVDVTEKVLTSQGVIGALGATEASKFVVLQGTPTKALKRIQAIVPNQVDATWMDLKFDTSELYTHFNESLGTIVTAMDKLDFDTGIVSGMDGYRYGTGLIGEVNRVIYGDPRDPATYPGVAGAGVKVNISGPLVKRLSVSLAIRIRLGVNPTDVINRVRSAVAAAINDSGIGKPIAISTLVAAASKVNGVIAVSIISPTYSSGNDLIAIQPSEKALVLNAETDISVSIVGE